MEDVSQAGPGKRPYGMKCAAIDCTTYQKDAGISLYRFPKETDRCSKWVQNLRSQKLDGIPPEKLRQIYRICSHHFEESQFMNPKNKSAGLIRSAVPTLIEAPNTPKKLASGKKTLKPNVQFDRQPKNPRLQLVERKINADVSKAGPDKQPYGMKCAAINCTTYPKDADISLYQFPKEADKSAGLIRSALPTLIDALNPPKKLASERKQPNSSILFDRQPKKPRLQLVKRSIMADVSEAEPDKRPYGMKCAAINCTTYQKDAGVSMYRFPKEGDRCSKWVQNVRNQKLDSIPPEKLRQIYRVCSRHFEESQFMNCNKKSAGLIRTAVPTLIEAPNPPKKLASGNKPPKSRIQFDRQQKKPNLQLVERTTSEMEQYVSQETENEIKTELSVTQETEDTSQKDAVTLLHEARLELKRLKVQVSTLRTTSKNLHYKSSKSPVTKHNVFQVLKTILPVEAYECDATQIRLAGKEEKGFRYYDFHFTMCQATSEMEQDVTKETEDVTESDVTQETEDVTEPNVTQESEDASKTESGVTQKTEDTVTLLQKARQEIKRLRVQVSKLRKTTESLLYKSSKSPVTKYNVLQVLKTILPGEAYEFVATQIRLAGKGENGFRYTLKDKTFALSMYSARPELYRLLRKVFKLPAPRTLQRVLASKRSKSDTL